jgi:hypothetical protein
MIITKQRFGKRRLNAGIVVPERTFIAEQRFGNQATAAMKRNERVHLLGNGIDIFFVATDKTG